LITAPEPPPASVIVTVGLEVYPVPPASTTIAVITPETTVAWATAPEPPPPVILTTGDTKLAPPLVKVIV